jgi:predicted metal-binding membrane protein
VAFLGVSALLFAVCAVATVGWGVSMPTMWMRMPGQTWPGFAASFLGMWVVMMVAMMLPSLAPMLWRYRAAMGRSWPTALVGGGYFFVWTLFGMAALALGVVLTTLAMENPALARAMPIAAGVVVLIAGAYQLTGWKVRELDACRALPAEPDAAWRYGLRLGLHCSRCCVGLMAILLVIGVMDLGALAAVAAAITIERLAPGATRVARATGVVVVGVGLFLIGNAV